VANGSQLIQSKALKSYNSKISMATGIRFGTMGQVVQNLSPTTISFSKSYVTVG